MTDPVIYINEQETVRVQAALRQPDIWRRTEPTGSVCAILTSPATGESAVIAIQNIRPLATALTALSPPLSEGAIVSPSGDVTYEVVNTTRRCLVCIQPIQKETAAVVIQQQSEDDDICQGLAIHPSCIDELGTELQLAWKHADIHLNKPQHCDG